MFCTLCVAVSMVCPFSLRDSKAEDHASFGEYYVLSNEAISLCLISPVFLHTYDFNDYDCLDFFSDTQMADSAFMSMMILLVGVCRKLNKEIELYVSDSDNERGRNGKIRKEWNTSKSKSVFQIVLERKIACSTKPYNLK